MAARMLPALPTLLAVAVSASTAAPIDEVSRHPPADDHTRVQLTLAPLATVGMGAASALFRFEYDIAWVPVGLSLPLDTHRSLDVDLGLLLVQNNVLDRLGWSVSVSAGPTWYFGDAKRSGFFVGPRFMVQATRSAGGLGIPASSGSGPIDLGPDVSRAFLAGFQLGYLWRVGPAVLGPELGASFGYAFDQRSPVVTPFRFEGTPSGRPDTFAFALDLNLLKVGVDL